MNTRESALSTAGRRRVASALTQLRAEYGHAAADPVGRALLEIAAEYAAQAAQAEDRALVAFNRGAGRHGMTWHTIAQTWHDAARLALRAVPPYDPPRCGTCGDLLWPGDRCDHTGTGIDRPVPFTVACPPCGLAGGPFVGGEPEAVQHAGTHDDLSHGGRPTTDVEATAERRPAAGRVVA
jgi:hypothetical protein